MCQLFSFVCSCCQFLPGDKIPTFEDKLCESYILGLDKNIQYQFNIQQCSKEIIEIPYGICKRCVFRNCKKSCFPKKCEIKVFTNLTPMNCKDLGWKTLDDASCPKHFFDKYSITYFNDLMHQLV